MRLLVPGSHPRPVRKTVQSISRLAAGRWALLPGNARGALWILAAAGAS